ncbi:unnamed protein product [Symbiodinium microadriaticum]|nr:unnamed protein product [Symbiodinium microadriaticum]
MIDYRHGSWGMKVLCLSRGSVIPKAICWSLPCAAATVLLHIYWGVLKGDENQELEGLGQVWSSFTFVFGFLIVFRSNQAYSRFWESVTLFHQTSGEWMSAFSNLLAFCNTKPEKSEEVAQFRFALMRLFSLLHCNALQNTSDLADDSLEILDVGGFGKRSLLHLKNSPDRTETVLLWIERLILDADRDKTLDVPAPILSRAFQELSRGMVSVTDLRKIRDVPFPFPYSQFLSLMLLAHWVLTPIVASQVIVKPYWAGIIVFVVSTAYWTLFYIAQEIDQPFGDDSNDLPVADMQREFNAKLEYFCLPMASKVPNVKMDTDYRLLVLDSGYGDIEQLRDECDSNEMEEPRGPMVSEGLGCARSTPAGLWQSRRPPGDVASPRSRGGHEGLGPPPPIPEQDPGKESFGLPAEEEHPCLNQSPPTRKSFLNTSRETSSPREDLFAELPAKRLVPAAHRLPADANKAVGNAIVAADAAATVAPLAEAEGTHCSMLERRGDQLCDSGLGSASEMDEELLCKNSALTTVFDSRLLAGRQEV